MKVFIHLHNYSEFCDPKVFIEKELPTAPLVGDYIHCLTEEDVNQIEFQINELDDNEHYKGTGIEDAIIVLVRLFKEDGLHIELHHRLKSLLS